MNKCSVDECERQDYCRGWCKMHYSRWQRYGSTDLQRVPAQVHVSKGYWRFDHKPVHVAIAEKALRRPLPSGAMVHHADEDKLNNEPSNLVICPDQNYHMLLHRRLRAFQATGNPNLRKCVLCQKWDDPANMYFPPSQHAGKHKACDAARHKPNWKQTLRGAAA